VNHVIERGRTLCGLSWRVLFGCEGFTWSQLGENFFPDMKAGGPCLKGLSPAAKSMLFERRVKWLEAGGRAGWEADGGEAGRADS
jgi:hypothetical protein